MQGLAVTLLLLAVAACQAQPAGGAGDGAGNGKVSDPEVLAVSATESVELGPEPVEVAVPLPAAANERILADGDGRLRLVLEGVELLRPGVHYRVYLNLPAGAKADPDGPYFLGHLPAYGKPDGETDRGFDVTAAVAALRQRGEWRDTLRVTLVPGHDPSELPAGPNLRFRRVALLAR